MGDYNPYLPQIVGNEWVPIQQPSVKLQRNVNNQELGVGFTLDTAISVTQAQYYTAQDKASASSTTYDQINVYPAGQEALSGPIRKVVIPVRSVSVTGASNWQAVDTINNSFCVGGAAGCNLVNSLSDYGSITFIYSGNPGNLVQVMAMSFAVQDFETELSGKRILNVSMLHRGAAFALAADDAGLNNITVPLQKIPGDVDALTGLQVKAAPGASATLLQYSGPTASAGFFDPLGTGAFTFVNDYPDPNTGLITQQTHSINLGDVTSLWSFPNPAGDSDLLSWNYEAISQFDDRSTNRRWLQAFTQIPQFLDGGAVSGTGRVRFSYVALEVTYCEETRVAVGGRKTIHEAHETITQATSTMHTMPLHMPLSYLVSPISFQPGNYTIAVASVNPGAISFAPLDVDYPDLSTTRPLNDLPSHPLTTITIPFPLDETALGKTFTKQESTNGVMMSLLDQNNFIRPETHVYGRQVPGLVYGSFVVTEAIVNIPPGGLEWPWIRFWARRFGDTSVPLTVSCGGSTASITPSEFDSLSRVTTEGWREITLALNPSLVISPPVSGSGSGLLVTWSSSGELAGNRWEILGSNAAAVSGYVQNTLPTYFSASPATYSGGLAQTWGLAIPGTGGTYASTPDNPTLDITGDIDLRADATLADWSDGQQQLIGKYQPTGDQRSYYLAMGGSGEIIIAWSSAGTAATVLTMSSSNLNLANGARRTVRATLDVNNGAGGRVATFFTGPSVDGPWTQVSTTTTAGTTSIFNSNTALEAGTVGAGTTNPINGVINAAQVRNGINGTIVSNVDFETQPAGTTVFTESLGLVWTLNGGVRLGSFITSSIPTTLHPSEPDVAVLLSQEVPPVTGFIPTIQLQELTGIGQNCGIDPCCVPTNMYFTSLSWSLPNGTNFVLQDLFNREEENSWGDPEGFEGRELIVQDNFNRTEVGQWGTPDIGPVWDNRNTTGGDPSVSGGLGLHTLDVADSIANEVTGVSITNGTVYIRNMHPQTTPIGDFIQTAALLRRDPEFVLAGVEWQTDGTANLVLETSNEAGPSVQISGITATQPVDLFMALYEENLYAWAAPSSMGIDFSDPPTLSMTVTVLNSGVVVIETSPDVGLDVTPPVVVQYGPIEIYDLDTSTYVPAFNPALSVSNGQACIDTQSSPDGETVTVEGVGSNYDLTTVVTNSTPASTIVGVRLPQVAGAVPTTLDTAALDITGDIDLRIDMTPFDFTPAGTYALISKWSNAAGNKSYLLNLNTDGTLGLAWSNDGTAVAFNISSQVPVPTNFPRITVRATLDVNNGAGGNTVTFYTAPSIDGTWDQLGNAVTSAGVTSIFPGNLPVEIGSHTGGAASLFNGIVNAAQIRASINGTIVANPDFGGQALNTTVFVDSAGLTWTLGAGARIEASLNAQVSVVGRTRYQMVLTNLNRTQPTLGIFLLFPTGDEMEIASYSLSGLFTGVTAPISLRYMLNGFDWKIKAWAPTIEEPAQWLAQYEITNFDGVFLPGRAGANYVSTPDNAALDITTNIDIRADVTMDDWTPVGTSTLIGKWTGGANQSYILNIVPGGNVSLWYSTTGANVIANDSTVATGFSNGTRHSIRATRDSTSGEIIYYTGPSIEGPWTRLGAAISGAAGAMFSGTAIGTVGAVDAGAALILNAIVHSAQIRSGIGGTIVANPNFAAQTEGATSFTDDAGRTWTVNNDAYIHRAVGVLTNDDIDIKVGPDNIICFSDLQIGAPQFGFGATEIQRRDEVETEWKTIMKATNSSVATFNDYEARPGIVSEYQIRRLNVYNFPSEWSPAVSGMVPAPGVVSNDCLEGGHLLLFTSNERQDGSINLAYSSVWMDQQVDENFTFPEASFVELQPMYDRDFYVAFRPLERGGEQFSRTVLVQAAAIPPETLADFTSLRDMAWEDVNYICVRDEDGNRWLATVQVPTGNVLRNRRLYLATVNISEVTETPTPVDPSPWS